MGINILKAHGKSARDGFLMNGFPLNTGRAAQGMPLKVAPAKIACLDFNLQKTKMQLGVQVLVTDPRELEKICQRLLLMARIGATLLSGAPFSGSPGIEDSDKSEAHLTSAAASVEVNVLLLHDLVAIPDLVNKADVESMERNGYENPSLPTVPETHYVETASHRLIYD
ncbi:hypothetical protein Ahy_B07g087371 isoform D [Arachis hypogaea]|uniref:Uncharacterized protein n=1 Tax=Arachis hypogaea TaxID=3818 RepID=A0A444YBX4_ARAHY|nr:hypothetical protein Ahy_B07g087371 isoform D [Arachis hypogaea]